MDIELQAIGEERRLPDWISAYMEYTEETEPPMLYHKWTGVVCISACLQRKCLVDYGDIPVYPNMYVVLVGPSATGKGIAMTFGQRLLQALALPIPGESITKEKLIQFMSKHCQCNDIDDQNFRHTHHSMTIFSKELAVFLGWENKDLMTWLTDWYDCDDNWSYQIKTGESNTVQGTFVNLFGATTPALVRTALPPDAIGGGFTSRIIFVYEDRKRKLVPFPIRTESMIKLREDLFHDLARIKMLAGRFKATDEFLVKFRIWYPEQHNDPPIKSQDFDGYNGRRHIHAIKLSMIVNASRCERMELEVEDLDRAVSIIKATEKNMLKVFQAAGESVLASPMSKLKIELIRKKEINLQDAYVLLHKDVDSRQIESILTSMQKAGLITITHVSKEPKAMADPRNTVIKLGQQLI